MEFQKYKSALAAPVLAVLLPLGAFADGDKVSEITHALTAEECSGCHMAYQPGFLPQRSWRLLMANLDDHFGEDASLDATDLQEIETYLVANASDRNGRKPRSLKNIPKDIVPLRISDLPWFTHEHGKRTRKRAMTRPEIGSISNCVACHRDADKGYFDDD